MAQEKLRRAHEQLVATLKGELEEGAATLIGSKKHVLELHDQGVAGLTTIRDAGNVKVPPHLYNPSSPLHPCLRPLPPLWVGRLPRWCLLGPGHNIRTGGRTQARCKKDQDGHAAGMMQSRGVAFFMLAREVAHDHTEWRRDY